VYFDAVSNAFAGLEIESPDTTEHTYIPRNKYRNGQFDPTDNYVKYVGDDFGNTSA